MKASAGRSGNNPGVKVFSISTTIRNPKRNIEFLEVLEPFNGKLLNNTLKEEIYVELIKQGIYRLNNLDNIILEKYKNNVELTEQEIEAAIIDNPQKTGVPGRLMTQIRALKDTGFVALPGKGRKKTLEITPLGMDLVNGKNTESVYSKAMIGMHANNPGRAAMHNRSRPFLNTLFVIDKINKHYNNNKGILWHEFAIFILSMNDCNYSDIADKIIAYREVYKTKPNMDYFEKYLFEELQVVKVLPKTILDDYADDVFRKFDMTGLLNVSGFGESKYIRFSEYNFEKVNSVLKEHSNYKFNDFETLDDYNDFLYEVNLPWEQSDEVKEHIIKIQKELLGVDLNENASLDQQLDQLDHVYNQKIFRETVYDFENELIKNELLILTAKGKEKSKFNDIPEPVRLEWLIALLTAQKFGFEYVKPNLSLDEKGIPKSFAAGGLADIEFMNEDMHCLIEVTLMRDYRQQINSETTSISDHLRDLDTDKEKCSMLVAPRIHNRVAEFFRFVTLNDNLMILALTIETFISIIDSSTTAKGFKNQIDSLNKKMCDDFIGYCDMINQYKYENNKNFVY